MIRTRNILKLLRQRIHSIVHGKYLSWVLMILIDNCATGKLRYAHNAIGVIHSVLFHRIDSRINLSSRTVKISGMNMNAERLAAYHFRMHTGRIGQPVVCVDNVKLLLTRHHSGYNRKVIDFFMQISRITAGKVHTAKVVDVHIREIRIDMVAQSVVLFRTHCRQTRLQIIIIDVTPYDRHLVHADYIQELLFFTCWLGHAESRFHIPLQAQSFSYSV